MTDAIPKPIVNLEQMEKDIHDLHAVITEQGAVIKRLETQVTALRRDHDYHHHPGVGHLPVVNIATAQAGFWADQHGHPRPVRE